MAPEHYQSVLCRTHQEHLAKLDSNVQELMIQMLPAIARVQGSVDAVQIDVAYLKEGLEDVRKDAISKLIEDAKRDNRLVFLEKSEVVRKSVFTGMVKLGGSIIGGILLAFALVWLRLK